MKVTFEGRGKVLMDDVRLLWPNFSGAPTKFNPRGGDRKFTVVVDNQEIADALIEAGCNLKIKPSEEPGDLPFMYFDVKVSYNFAPPVVWLVSGRKRKQLTEENVGTLDSVDMAKVDMDIRFGKEWTQNGITARTAYLDKIVVYQEIDRFAARWADEESPEE